MRKKWRGKMILGMMLVLSLALICAAQAGAEEETGLVLAKTPWGGDESLTLGLMETLTDMEANAFSGEEEIGQHANLSGGELIISLTRPLKKGEKVQIVMKGLDAEGNRVIWELIADVSNGFGIKCDLLDRRLAEMMEIFISEWRPNFEQGKVYVPLVWREFPFAVWPDETPEILVRQNNDMTEIALSEILPEDWRVRLGQGIPVTYADCVYDEISGLWRAAATAEEFETVYLVRSMEHDHFGISIPYERANSWRAGYPVVEYEEEEYLEEGGERFLAMNCYGWGTARSFNGAMFAIVSEERGIYAEYDADGVLMSYTDPYTECVYNASDNLVFGEEPKDWVNPVVH